MRPRHARSQRAGEKGRVAVGSVGCDATQIVVWAMFDVSNQSRTNRHIPCVPVPFVCAPMPLLFVVSHPEIELPSDRAIERSTFQLKNTTDVVVAGSKPGQ